MVLTTQCVWMCMAGKRGTTFVDCCVTAIQVHIDKQSHEYIVHGPNRNCMRDKEAQQLLNTAALQLQSTLISGPDGYIIHGPNRPMCTAGKRGTTFVECCFSAMTIDIDKRSRWIHRPWTKRQNIVEHCFTAMTIHTDKEVPMDTSSMDHTDQCVWQEKMAQHLFNADSHNDNPLR